MNLGKLLLRCSAAIAIAAAVAAPATATTLIRAGLEELTSANGTVVVGEVLDAHSYWNQDRSLILTDVRVAVLETLKGKGEQELTVTIMGGQIGDQTIQVIAGAELIPEKSYVLFLNQQDLPGAPGVTTVRDHGQGVFELLAADDEVRAVSQANRHPLVPDAAGRFDAPGGVDGMPIDTLIRSVRELAGRPPIPSRR